MKALTCANDVRALAASGYRWWIEDAKAAGGDSGPGPSGRPGMTKWLEQGRYEVLHLDAGPLADQFCDALAMAMCNVALIAQQAHRPA